MPWAGWFSWAVGLIALFIIIWSLRVAPHPAQTLTPPRAVHSLKPRAPDDCPLCQRPHPIPQWGGVRKPGVKPWSEYENPRGRPKTICTAGRACPCPECDGYGNTDPTFHAVAGAGVREEIQQFKCQACGKQFSSRCGTALYRLHTSTADVAQALLAFNLGLSVAAVQLRCGHLDLTLRTWLTRAGMHAEKMHQHFFCHPCLDNVVRFAVRTSSARVAAG